MTSRSGRAGRGGGKDGPSKAGGSDFPKAAASSSSNTPSIPHNISFYVRIQPISPDYGGQPIRHSEERYWVPPTRPNGLADGPESAILLRWEGGRVTVVPGNSSLQGPGLNGSEYQTATVFTQHPDTPNFLVVPFDARTRNVLGGWHCITFNHHQIGNSNRYYSYVSERGAEQRIAAPGSQHWMDQLLPRWYDCENAEHATRTQAGLIGELSLLFALAAFSAPPAFLGLLRQFIAPRKWMSHNQATGHVPQRGMVVTVYLDPHNPQWSTRNLLNRLQNGDFGPFYGPN